MNSSSTIKKHIDNRCPPGFTLQQFKLFLQNDLQTPESVPLSQWKWKTNHILSEFININELTNICMEYIVPTKISDSSEFGFHEGAQFIWKNGQRGPIFYPTVMFWCKFGFLDLLKTHEIFSNNKYSISMEDNLTAFWWACKSNQLEVVKFALHKFKHYPQRDIFIERLFNYVCYYCADVSAINEFIYVMGYSGIYDWNEALGIAIKTKNYLLQQKIINSQNIKITDWNPYLVESSQIGNLSNVKYAIETKGATNLVEAIAIAHFISKTHLNCWEYLRQKKHQINTRLWQACERGSLEDIKEATCTNLSHIGPAHLNQALAIVCKFWRHNKNNNIKIARFLIEKGAGKLCNRAWFARKYNHASLLQEIQKKHPSHDCYFC